MMLKIQTFILLLSAAPIIFDTSEGYTYLHERKLNGGPIEADVEVLVVCDNEFSSRFKHKRQKIIDYWAVYMTDVNMRFRTLTSVNVSFRVSALIIINDTVDQPFIEQARENDTSILLSRVWDHFGKWAYNHQMSHTDFDIALLVTGAQLSGAEITAAYYSQSQSGTGGTACLKNETSKLHLSTIVMHSSATWGNTCASLETAFAEMLGAEYDKDTFCSSEKYLMTTDACNSRQYMFSKCSNAGITKFLKSSQAACLYKAAAAGINVIDAATVTHPPSLTDQCAMITNNKSAVTVKQDNNSCVLSKCYLLENGHWTYSKMLSPVDNSPCGHGKICFRGECLPQGFLLRNVGSSKCLYSGSRYSRHEYITMVQCLENPMPVDQLRILKNGQKGDVFLTSPYWSADQFLYMPEMEECLSVNMENENEDKVGNYLRLQYASCQSAEEKNLGWEFIELLDGNNNSKKEYLLSHRYTNSCAKVFPDNSIKLNKACDKNDNRMRWTFIQQPIVSLDWFNNTNVVKSSKMIHSKRSTISVNENGTKFQDNSFNLILIGILCFCLVCLSISVFIYFLRCHRARAERKAFTVACSYESVKMET